MSEKPRGSSPRGRHGLLVHITCSRDGTIETRTYEVNIPLNAMAPSVLLINRYIEHQLFYTCKSKHLLIFRKLQSKSNYDLESVIEYFSKIIAYCLFLFFLFAFSFCIKKLLHALQTPPSLRKLLQRLYLAVRGVASFFSPDISRV